MSSPQFQDPYASPHQSVPLYGQQHPGPAHTGKLIAAIVLLVAGPLLGVLLGVVAAVGVAVNILAAGEVIGNGQVVTVNGGRYYSDVRFTAPQSGEYRLSCSGLRDGDSVPVGPTITLDLFVWPFLIGLGASVTCCWVIAAALLIRRHLARRGVSRPGP